jgi:2-oxoisovalerate dehydrogenase E1 component beta subunit
VSSYPGVEVATLPDVSGWRLRHCGYGAEVAAIVAEEAFDYLDGPVTRIAGPDVPGVPYNHALEDWFMVNPEKIADGIRKLAAY